MNILQAKQILAAYPIDEANTNDPEFKEALELVHKNEQLKEWFRQEQLFDKVFAKKLETLVPPEELKEKIFSDFAIAKKTPTTIREASTTSPSNRKWIWPFAIAACFVILTFISFNITRTLNPSSEIDAFFTAVIEYGEKGNFDEFQPGDWAVIEKTLENNNAPLPHTLPIKFQNIETEGCLSFSYKGHPISLLCFKKKDTVYHLYVVDLEEVDRWEPIPEPTYKTLNDRPAATWTDDSNLNIMLVEDDEKESLKQLL